MTSDVILSTADSQTNNTNSVLQLQSNHSGVSFVLILDGCVFILGLLILFCCLRNLRLWKRKKTQLNATATSTGSGHLDSEKNVFKRFFKRLFHFILFESEYERI